MITFLGVIAAIAFLISGGPLAWAVYKAQELEGFSKLGWLALSIALIAVTWQLTLLHAPMLLLDATAINTVVVCYVTVQVWRKS